MKTKPNTIQANTGTDKTSATGQGRGSQALPLAYRTRQKAKGQSLHVAALIYSDLFKRSQKDPSSTSSDIYQCHRVWNQNPEKTLSYLTAGDSSQQSVIFIHGTPGNAAGWMEYLSNVPKDLHYIAVDRPGYGQSDPEQAVTSLDEQAKAIVPLLEQSNGHWPILVGHSLGAPIAAKVATKFPNLVGGLILVSAAMDPVFEKTHPAQHLCQKWPVARLLPQSIQNSNHELIALKDELQILTHQLAAIECPTSILHGTQDNLVPYGNVAFMKRHIPFDNLLEIMTLTGRNHFLPWNSKGLLDSAVTNMTREIQHCHTSNKPKDFNCVYTGNEDSSF